jgi:uncharacterized protein YciI
MNKCITVIALLLASVEATPPNMSTYYVVFLRRGPAWTAEMRPDVIAVSEGHMANIRRLAATGKLVISGPFLDQEGNGALAGLFIFRVESSEEARQLTETDPAVKAKRFTYEIVPWLGPKTLRY